MYLEVPVRLKASVTESVTWKLPWLTKVWAGLRVAPSPKFHA